MSRAEVKAASCEGKKRFDSMEQAKRVARRRRRWQGITGQPYHCRFCHFVHIGTPSDTHQKANRRPRPEPIPDEEEGFA